MILGSTLTFFAFAIFPLLLLSSLHNISSGSAQILLVSKPPEPAANPDSSPDNPVQIHQPDKNLIILPICVRNSSGTKKQHASEAFRPDRRTKNLSQDQTASGYSKIVQRFHLCSPSDPPGYPGICSPDSIKDLNTARSAAPFPAMGPAPVFPETPCRILLLCLPSFPYVSPCPE